MRVIKVSTSYSSNLNSDFNQIATIEVENNPFNEGAFGEVYLSMSVNNKKTSVPQIIKIFKDNISGSADLNYNTIQKLQKKLSKKSDELVLNQKKLLEEYPAFLAIPQFSFTGILNGKKVKGFSSNNLKSLGFEEFKEILENDYLLDQYQSVPIEKKMIIAYHFVSAFKVLKECSFIHADIKPEAIFINTKNDTCAIIDFDSGVVTDKITDDATTWGAPNDWVAPEIWDQLGQVSNQQRKIQVDLFTDIWSVAIGIHYFLATCHPLFFLKELSRNVIDEYFHKDNNKWPEINKNASYFNLKYSTVYDKYIGFLNSSIPHEVKEQIASTINQGYQKPHLRTAYDKWKIVLKNVQIAPAIQYFETDRTIALSGTPILLKWAVLNAFEIIIDNGVGDVSGLTELNVFPISHSTFKLTATGYFGTVTAETKVEIFPKLEIKSFRIDKQIALLNDEVVLSWEVVNFTKINLEYDGVNQDVTNQFSFKLIADKSKEIKLVCESIKKITSITESKSLKVVEKVVVNSFDIIPRLIIQSKPISLIWKVSNATTVTLLPIKKIIPIEGSLELMPKVKTVYIIEAENELTSDRSQEIAVDVLPLPTITNIRLAIPPKLAWSDYKINKMTYPLYVDKETKPSFFRFADIISNIFISHTPKSGKSSFIFFNQHKTYIEIKKGHSIFGILSLLKSLIYFKRPNSHINIKNK